MLELEVEQKLITPKYRYEWEKYDTQLLNIANGNAKSTTPKKIGSIKDLWLKMQNDNIRNTLENWENYFNKQYGTDRIEKSAKLLFDKCCQMFPEEQKIGRFSLQLCKIYIEEIVYNKTYLGMCGEFIAMETVSNYFGLNYKFSNKLDEVQGIDAFLGEHPCQIKTSKHKNYHHDKRYHQILLIQLDQDKMICKVVNPDIIPQYEQDILQLIDYINKGAL